MLFWRKKSKIREDMEKLDRDIRALEERFKDLQQSAAVSNRDSFAPQLSSMEQDLERLRKQRSQALL